MPSCPRVTVCIACDLTVRIVGNPRLCRYRRAVDVVLFRVAYHHSPRVERVVGRADAGRGGLDGVARRGAIYIKQRPVRHQPRRPAECCRACTRWCCFAAPTAQMDTRLPTRARVCKQAASPSRSCAALVPLLRVGSWLFMLLSCCRCDGPAIEPRVRWPFSSGKGRVVSDKIELKVSDDQGQKKEVPGRAQWDE